MLIKLLAYARRNATIIFICIIAPAISSITGYFSLINYYFYRKEGIGIGFTQPVMNMLALVWIIFGLIFIFGNVNKSKPWKPVVVGLISSILLFLALLFGNVAAHAFYIAWDIRCRSGDATGCMGLSIFYQRGILVEKDVEKSDQLDLLSCKLGRRCERVAKSCNRTYAYSACKHLIKENPILKENCPEGIPYYDEIRCRSTKQKRQETSGD